MGLLSVSLQQEQLEEDIENDKRRGSTHDSFFINKSLCRILVDAFITFTSSRCKGFTLI